MENWAMDTMNERKKSNNIVTNPYRELLEIEGGPDRIIIIFKTLPMEFVGNFTGHEL